MRACKYYIILLVGLLLSNETYAYVYGNATADAKPQLGGIVSVRDSESAAQKDINELLNIPELNGIMIGKISSQSEKIEKIIKQIK